MSLTFVIDIDIIVNICGLVNEIRSMTFFDSCVDFVILVNLLLIFNYLYIS